MEGVIEEDCVGVSVCDFEDVGDMLDVCVNVEVIDGVPDIVIVNVGDIDFVGVTL